MPYDDKLQAAGEPLADAPLLEVRNLHSRYGPVRVIHDISLNVQAGELVALPLERAGLRLGTVHTRAARWPPSCCDS